MLVGAFASIRKIARVIKGTVKRVSAIMALAEHELNHNSGTSTKDAAFAAANAAADAAETGKKALEVSEATHAQFTAFLVEYSREQSALWQAVSERKAV